jgi:hypothetical protein
VIDSNNATAIFPIDRVPGCLPRKSKPGEWCPMLREHIKIIPSSDWEAAAQKIGDSLRKKVWTILDQDGVGSCATESTTGSVMLGRSCQGLAQILLNPWYIYHTTSGGYDQGSSIDDNLAFARDHGIAPESVWPRSKGWRGEPSADAVEAAKSFRIEEFWEIANINEFVTAILEGFPVVFGAQGHAIVAVQHMGSYPLILNSWGAWEDGGFGKWCSYNAIEWGYGAFAMRVAT